MVKERKFCILCGEEVEVKIGLLSSTTVCPKCGTVLQTRRTLFGREVYTAHHNGESERITIACMSAEK